MSRANSFMKKATQFLETTQRSFYLKKPVLGWSFTEDERRTIPKGDYVVVEPDDRSEDRMIVSQKKTYHLYSISKHDIPKQ